MELAIYISTTEVDDETIPLEVGFAKFELMGNEEPETFEYHSLSAKFNQAIPGLVAEAERIWVGPHIGLFLTLFPFASLLHPQLRDAQSLFEFIPHLPYEYPANESAQTNARVMCLRIRSCVDALIQTGS